MNFSSFPIKKFTEVMQIRGVSVRVHWSLLVIGALILVGAFERPAETLAAWTAYFGVLLIHECGHMIVAQRKGCRVFAIELYPIHGLVVYELARSRYDDAVIAWGGVLAQAAVGMPLVAFVSIFGFTRFPALNAVVGILGYFSLFVAALNLLPIRPLDGSRAWYVFSALGRRPATKIEKKEGSWRAYR
jgi:Zn-dependent protease